MWWKQVSGTFTLASKRLLNFLLSSSLKKRSGVLFLPTRTRSEKKRSDIYYSAQLEEIALLFNDFEDVAVRGVNIHIDPAGNVVDAHVQTQTNSGQATPEKRWGQGV